MRENAVVEEDTVLNSVKKQVFGDLPSLHRLHPYRAHPSTK